MEHEYIQQRIEALERELKLVKRRIISPKPSQGEIKKRIHEYENLVEDISRSLKVKECPDAYIAKLRAKEY